MTRVKKELLRMRTLVIILAVGLVLAIGYGVMSNVSINELPELATYTVARGDVERIVSADGTLTGTQTRSVYYPSGGKITKNNAKLGNRVNSGDVLAEVEQKGTLGTTTSEVTSPIRGRIVQINYFVNDTVNSPSVAGVVITDDAQLNIETYVNENDIAYIKKDQAAEIVFPALTLDETYAAKVIKIDYAPSTLSSAVDYKVTLRLVEKPKSLRLGMSANIEILTAKVEDALAIPESYLIERDDKHFVKKLIWENKEEGLYQIQEVEIELGLMTDEFVEVTKGLSLNEELIEPSFVAERNSGLLRGLRANN